MYPLLRKYLILDKPFVDRAELLKVFDDYCRADETHAMVDSSLAHTMQAAHEAAIEAPWIYLAVRPQRARWKYLRFHVELMSQEEIDVREYLKFKEHVILSNGEPDLEVLEVDFGPFRQNEPMLKEARLIGRGAEFLNRNLFNDLFDNFGRGDKVLLDFLLKLQHRGRKLMLSTRIKEIADLRVALRFAEEYLSTQDKDLSWQQVEFQLQAFGLEGGWGNTVARSRETLKLFTDLLEAPNPDVLQQFIARIPTVFQVVIIAPQGYFGQSNVLGLPETGGQVVYILDQIRALERELKQRLLMQGLDIDPRLVIVTRLIPEAQHTTCNQREERLMGTQHAKIIRVPYRTRHGDVLAQWISRFEVWPYLERFALEASKEILCEFEGRPDLIIGNASDGNLVATLLARRLGVTQCNIAHVLEKARYEFSDLQWANYEYRYHFACRYTADLVAMNAADFIVTHSVHEIAGRDDQIGQYECYQSFALPTLYRVLNGIDLLDPRFNVVAPGTNTDVFFSHKDKTRRLSGLEDEITSLVFGEPDKKTRGMLADCDKRLLFAMGRLHRAKNITGLVEWYALNPELQARANLLIVGGRINPADSLDAEEHEEIRQLHRLMDRYQLDDKVRWIGRHLERNLTGELCRYVADMQGVYVHPALFEPFGTTIVEAMACGLPAFVTRYGGPLEIIVDGVSGFHMDPRNGAQCAELLTRFIDQCEKDQGYWEKISVAAIERVAANFNWKTYADKFIQLAQFYGFWKYAVTLDRDASRRYLEMFQNLQYRALATEIEKNLRH